MAAMNSKEEKIESKNSRRPSVTHLGQDFARNIEHVKQTQGPSRPLSDGLNNGDHKPHSEVSPGDGVPSGGTDVSEHNHYTPNIASGLSHLAKRKEALQHQSGRKTSKECPHSAQMGSGRQSRSYKNRPSASADLQDLNSAENRNETAHSMVPRLSAISGNMLKQSTLDALGVKNNESKSVDKSTKRSSCSINFAESAPLGPVLFEEDYEEEPKLPRRAKGRTDKGPDKAKATTGRRASYNRSVQVLPEQSRERARQSVTAQIDGLEVAGKARSFDSGIQRIATANRPNAEVAGIQKTATVNRPNAATNSQSSGATMQASQRHPPHPETQQSQFPPTQQKAGASGTSSSVSSAPATQRHRSLRKYHSTIRVGAEREPLSPIFSDPMSPVSPSSPSKIFGTFNLAAVGGDATDNLGKHSMTSFTNTNSNPVDSENGVMARRLNKQKAVEDAEAKVSLLKEKSLGG